MNKKVYIIHRWGGNPKSDWYSYAKSNFESKGYEVVILDMPNTEEPKIDEWVSYLQKLVPNPDENTYFIGHSIGCQTIMRYLERLENTKIGGAVFVAGWFTLTGLETEEEKSIAKPWLETPIDFSKIKDMTSNLTAILSDNDPYVPLEETKKMFEEKLGAKVIIEKYKGHFTEDDNVFEIPIILDFIK